MTSEYSTEDYRTASIRLHRSPCFGPCPVYTLTVTGDGWVVYQGDSNVEITGRREAFVGEASVRNLISTFLARDFFTHALLYRCEFIIEDAPSTSLRMNIGWTPVK